MLFNLFIFQIIKYSMMVSLFFFVKRRRIREDLFWNNFIYKKSKILKTIRKKNSFLMVSNTIFFSMYKMNIIPNLNRKI